MAVSYQPTEYLYLSARLRAKEAGLVGKEDLSRYALMKDAAEIMAALVAEGKIPADTPREAALAAMLREGFDTVREGAPDPAIFAFLQYPYDAHNVKTALKCYFAKRSPEPLYLDVGTVSASELADMILAIPFVVLRPEIVANWIEGANHVRLHIAAHIVVPGIDATKAYFHRHAFQRAVVHRCPVHIAIVAVLIFRVAHDSVVTELVALVQEVYELHGFATDVGIRGRLSIIRGAGCEILLIRQRVIDQSS